jgi:hypothetical protein
MAQTCEHNAANQVQLVHKRSNGCAERPPNKAGRTNRRYASPSFSLVARYRFRL